MEQGTVDEIAALFWEQAESRFHSYPDQHEAMADAETMALDFLTQNEVDPKNWTTRDVKLVFDSIQSDLPVV